MTPATSEFVPISPNPFIVGNPVRDPSMFFGRETEFTLVAKRFGQSNGGCLMVFCGERRSGKTSILLQIQQGRLGPDYVPVLIDMQAMAVEGEIEFLSRIAMEVIKQLGEGGRGMAPPDFEAASKPSAAFLKFIDSVLDRHPNRKLVLLFDEYELLEDKIDGGALTQDVLLILSSMMESSDVFLVFTGSQHLDERRRDYWRILHKAHEYRHISYLQRDDALRLIREPLAGRATYEGKVVDRIFELTAGHPFYTQAICRNLVDAMNDDRTVVATEQMLEAVVEHIVNYPFPQMTFLWETLEADQRLTLALLAQSLDGEGSFATVGDLRRTIREGGYPLPLGKSAIATALEALFRQEFLAKNDDRHSGYGFRMDLWRQWVRRMHSVWQVMREVGLDVRRRRWKRSHLAAVGGLAVIAVGVLAYIIIPPIIPPPRPPLPAPAAPTAFVVLTPQPADARVYRDGAAVAVGEYRRAVPADRDHEFTVRAPGYVDSTFTLRVADADTQTVAVALRPQRGGLRIEADPPEARIFLDGVEIGTGSAERSELLVPESHVVEARLEGHHSATLPVQVHADTTVALALVLSPVTTDFNVVTTPDRAEIFVDGTLQGISPLVVPDLAFGSHRIEARRAGYLPADTTFTIDDSASHLRLELLVEPPGVLVVRGDQPARIYIDERQIGSGELPNSGATRVVAGSHKVEIVFRDGTGDQVTIDVRPDEVVELLWEKRKLRLLAEAGE